MKIRAVGFDYGGVIGAIDQLGRNFTKNVCHTLDISKADFQLVYFKYNHLINTGKIANWYDFWKIILKQLNKSDKIEQVMEITNQVRKGFGICDTRILSLINSLRSKGFKTGLLSNGTVDNGVILRAQGIDKYFDVFHISAETGLQKPDPKAFRLFAKSLGFSLDQLVFIDDTEKSLSTSQTCGYIPILYSSFHQLEKDLFKII